VLVDEVAGCCAVAVVITGRGLLVRGGERFDALEVVEMAPLRSLTTVAEDDEARCTEGL